MRIVYVDRSRWWGGAEESLAWLASGMRRRGHQVEIVVDFPQPHQDRFIAEGLSLHPRMARRPIWGAERWRNPPPGLDRLGVILRARTLAAILGRSRADIVHINLLRNRSRWDARAAKSAGCRIVGHLRQLRHQSMPSSETFALCDQVIAVSEVVAEQARASGCATSMEVIYDGVDAARFQHHGDQTSARAALGLPEAGTIVGFPAALEPRKGQDIALEVFARMSGDYPDAILVFAGDGTDLAKGDTYVSRLMRRAEAPDLAGKVRFIGPCADMAAFYAATDFALALSRDGEAFGRVPVEAAFGARPTIGVRAGAAPEVIVDGETGLLAEPGDADSAAAALRRLLGAGDLTAKMGDRARERAIQLFDSEEALNAFEALYARLVGAAGQA